MKKVLIGSKALNHHYPEWELKINSDTDYAVDQLVKNKHFGIEYLYNPIITERYEGDSIITKDDLTTLKASHLMWNIQFEKHLYHLQFLLKKGNTIDSELFFKLYEFWNEYHSKNKRSDLKMSKEDFFTNAINYDENQHDEIHLMLNPTPIYTKVLKDGAEVELDENKFHNLSFEDKLDFVREEVYVMAWERWKDLQFQVAYSKMLKKFIISHCPLFALTFVLENYIELHKPKINYIKKINDELNIRHS